jgi:hypothetical protein
MLILLFLLFTNSTSFFFFLNYFSLFLLGLSNLPFNSSKLFIYQPVKINNVSRLQVSCEYYMQVSHVYYMQIYYMSY